MVCVHVCGMCVSVACRKVCGVYACVCVHVRMLTEEKRSLPGQTEFARFLCPRSFFIRKPRTCDVARGPCGLGQPVPSLEDTRGTAAS